MTVIGAVLVLLPFSNPQESFYEFIAIGMVLLGIPVYFILVRGWYRPPILTTINGKCYNIYMCFNYSSLCLAKVHSYMYVI